MMIIIIIKGLIMIIMVYMLSTTSFNDGLNTWQFKTDKICGTPNSMMHVDTCIF